MTGRYRLLRRILGTVPDELYTPRAFDPASHVRLRYLGTAGFVIESPERTIVVDPYVSRPGGRETLFGRLLPKPNVIRKHIPRADDVLIGHAHHDHVLDGPELCRQTGARFIGSPDACNVARAAGLDSAQIRETLGRETIPCGNATARGLPSAHGRVYFNRVTLAGTIEAPPPWPPHFTDLKHGLVLNWLIEVSGVRIVHIDSAEFFAHELEGVRCDVLCLCAIGRRYRPNYVQEAVRLLKPRYVVPCHWDLFTTPFEDPPLLLPDVDLPGMLEEIAEAGPEPVLLPFSGTFCVPRP